MSEWGSSEKGSLTPREVLLVAHAHLIIGVDQHELASVFDVNPGRINEAVFVVRNACDNHRELYKAMHAKKEKE